MAKAADSKSRPAGSNRSQSNPSRRGAARDGSAQAQDRRAARGGDVGGAHRAGRESFGPPRAADHRADAGGARDRPAGRLRAVADRAAQRRDDGRAHPDDRGRLARDRPLVNWSANSTAITASARPSRQRCKPRRPRPCKSPRRPRPGPSSNPRRRQPRRKFPGPQAPERLRSAEGICTPGGGGFPSPREAGEGVMRSMTDEGPSSASSTARDRTAGRRLATLDYPSSGRLRRPSSPQGGKGRALRFL